MSYVGVNPNWAPDPQHYAIYQEQWRHDQALYAYGEYAFFCLLWRIRDHQNGLVGRCPTCYLSRGKIAETYGQAAQERCPDCFGTSFEGGYKALVVRPMIFSTDEESEDVSARGIVIRQTATLQTTSDIDLVEDFMFRADGSRWQVEGASSTKLTTGFEYRNTGEHGLGAVVRAVREDESSVAYMIPPDTATVIALLDRTHFRTPLDFSAVEDVRGPLV